MKKIITVQALFMLILIAYSANAQKASENYFSKIDLTVAMQKSDSGQKRNLVDLNINGVYGCFFYQLMREQPFKKFQSEERLTIGTVGYGKQMSVGNGDMNLVWGAGFTCMLMPDTIPKIDQKYWGGGLWAHINSEEKNFDAEVTVNYAVLPQSSDNIWSHGMGVVNAEAIKFFGKYFGFGINYKLKLNTISERNVEYPDNFIFTESNLSPSLYARLGKTGGFLFKAGPSLRRMSGKYTSGNQSVSYGKEGRNGINVGVILIFHYKKD